MKKNCLIFIFYFLSIQLSLASNGSNKPYKVTYYSTVEFVETPLSKIKGSISLTPEIALTRHHYRFSYDAKNRLVSVAFFNGPIPKSPNHTGNLFTLAHRMEFSFSQNNEVIRFFDKNDKPISVLGNCSKFVYQLNELGFRKSLHFLDSNNKPVENSWNIYEYTWEYLDNGAVIEDRFNGQGKQVSIRPGFEFYKLRLYFNHAGHITLMQNIDKDGNLVENSSGASQDNITTNSDGNFLQWQVLNNQHQLEKGNGPNIAIGIQTFNEFGYEIALEHRDENNQPIYNTYGICRSRTSFDKFGNLAGRRFYNEQNEPSNHQIAGYHQLKIIWDTSGNNRASLSYYDTNGQPTHHATRGYHAVKYAYDKSNKLIKVSYLDTRGNLINRKDNKTAYITYQYNNDGTQTSIQRFDNQGIALNQ